MSTEKPRVLFVGLVCVDIIYVCKTYPEEDTDQRCIESRWQRGGNAANSAAVAAMTGNCDAYFMGVLCKSRELKFLEDCFHNDGINISKSVVHSADATPTSIVLVNKENGSRTIVHSDKHLPEIRYTHFEDNIEIGEYKWIHFEGRPNYTELKKMLESIRKHNSNTERSYVWTSLEIEKKHRTELYSLMPLVDVTFISKEHAVAQGHTTAASALQAFSKYSSASGMVVCAWGDKGASAISVNSASMLVTSPAYSPDKVVDTLAAGDVFNAAVLDTLIRGESLQQALTFGCRIAGAKCGFQGLSGLKDVLGHQ